jgi:hypothetical protein
MYRLASEIHLLLLFSHRLYSVASIILSQAAHVSQGARARDVPAGCSKSP